MLGADHGAPLDHPPQASLCQSPGGVLTGEHDVEHDTQGVDIRPSVGLCKAKLLRGGIAHRAEDLCILSACGVILPGGVKVNEDGGPASEKDIPWLHIPMDNTSAMEHLLSSADLPGDIRSLFWRKGPPILQQEGDGVALDVLLQN